MRCHRRIPRADLGGFLVLAGAGLMMGAGALAALGLLFAGWGG